MIKKKNFILLIIKQLHNNFHTFFINYNTNQVLYFYSRNDVISSQ